MRKPVISALGKVRVEAEFIAHAYGEPQISFAQWMDEGIGHAVDRGGVAWRDRFRSAGPQAFLYRAPVNVQAKSVLLGVLGPSEDRFARPFPFAVMTELSEAAYAGSASTLPVAAERFVAAAAEVCRAAPDTKRATDILARVGEIQVPDQSEYDRTTQDFLDWQAQDGIVAALWPRLFSSGASGADRCLRHLIEMIVPMRTHAGIGTCRGVRLPLGGGGAAAASFWLDVVRVLAQQTRTVPAVFWPAEGAAGAVLIQLGEVAPSSFVELWPGAERDPLVLDLTGPDLPSPPDTRPLSSQVARVIADPKARVRGLLDALISC